MGIFVNSDNSAFQVALNSEIYIVVIVAAILFGMRKDRKNGKGSCGGDCSKCKGCH